MKRSILLTMLFAAATPLATAQAQNVTVAATVASSINITESGNVDFGTIAPGAAASSLSNYEATIAHNTSVTATLNTTTVAMTSAGGGSFNVTLWCGMFGTAGQQPTGTTGCTTGLTTATAVGTSYFAVSGRIAAGATTGQPAGSYTGSATVTFTPPDNTP